MINVASAYEHSGYSPDEIVDLYPVLSLADIHTALAYYDATVEDFRDAMGEHEGDTASTA